MAGREKGSGLQGEIVDFFERNPDEFLLIDDIQVKYGGTRRQITACLHNLRKAGAIYTRGGLVMRGVTVNA